MSYKTRKDAQLKELEKARLQLWEKLDQLKDVKNLVITPKCNIERRRGFSHFIDEFTKDEFFELFKNEN